MAKQMFLLIALGCLVAAASARRLPGIPVPEFVEPYESVGKCPPRDTNETVYLPDSASCSTYYVCSNGNPIQKECPADMYWNTEKHICDWELDVECNLNGTLYIQPLTAVGKCPIRDGNETVFLPDSDNCTIYYICSNGRPNQAACAPGMVWSSKLKTCDWDFDEDCVADSEQGVRDVTPLTAVGKCPIRDGNVTVFLPDSDNCTIYYICSNGRPFQAKCTPGMVWSIKLNVCDWDYDEDCVPDSEQQGSFRKPAGTCPEVNGEMPVYLADQDNCHNYYECNNGVAIQNNCPGDLVWNTVLNVCDFDLDGDCIPDDFQRKVNKPRSPVGKCPPINPSIPVYLPDSEDCQLYYECDNGLAKQNNCPDDLEFNPKLNVCDDPLDAGCSITGTTSSPSSSSSSAPDTTTTDAGETTTLTFSL